VRLIFHSGCLLVHSSDFGSNTYSRFSV